MRRSVLSRLRRNLFRKGAGRAPRFRPKAYGHKVWWVYRPRGSGQAEVRSENGRHDLKHKRHPPCGFGNDPVWRFACHSFPFVSERAVAPVTAAGDTDRHDQDGRSDHEAPREHAQDASQDLRLEIAEDESGAELVYRFVDAQSGDIIREWNAGEFGKLRDYMRDKKIHLLDKKI